MESAVFRAGVVKFLMSMQQKSVRPRAVSSLRRPLLRRRLALWLLGVCALLPMNAAAIVQRAMLNSSFEGPSTVEIMYGTSAYIGGNYPSGYPGYYWMTTSPVMAGYGVGELSRRYGSCADGGSNCRPMDVMTNSESIAAAQGRRWQELNGGADSMLFQPICVKRGERFNYSFYHTSRDRNSSSHSVFDEAEFRMGVPVGLPDNSFPNADSYSFPIVRVKSRYNPASASIVQSYFSRGMNGEGEPSAATKMVGDGKGWGSYQGSFQYNGGTQIVNFGFVAKVAGGGNPYAGNEIDDVHVGLSPFVEFTKSQYRDAKGASLDKPRIRVVGDLTVDNIPLVIAIDVLGGTAVEEVNYHIQLSNGAGYQWARTATGLSLTLQPKNFDGLGPGAGDSNNGEFELPITLLTTGTRIGDKTLNFSIADSATAAYLVDSTEVCGGVGRRTSSYTAKQPPLIVKAFTPQAIEINGTARLSWSIQNAAGDPVQPALGFVDVLPSGLKVANPPSVQSNCGGVVSADPGGGQLSLSGGGLNAGQSGCTVSVLVQPAPGAANASCEGPPPDFTSTRAALSRLVGLENGAGDACLIVTSPTVMLTSRWDRTEIEDGASAKLTLELRNSTTAQATGLYFSDILPANLAVLEAAGVTIGGAAGCTAANLPVTLADTAIILNATKNDALGIVPANAMCTITVGLRNVAGQLNPDCISPAAAPFTHGAGNVGAIAAALVNGMASQCLIVRAKPQLSHSFQDSAITAGGTTLLKFRLEGAPGIASSGLGFTSRLPSNIRVANVSAPIRRNSCGGTVSAAAGGEEISLSGGAIALDAGGCNIEVEVSNLGGASGATNMTAPCSGAGFELRPADVTVNGLAPVLDKQCLRVVPRAVLSKVFTTNAIPFNGTTRVIYTITKDRSALAHAVTGMGFTDNFPTSLALSHLPNISNSCGATLTHATPGSQTLTISDVSIAPDIASCEVGFNITHVREDANASCPNDAFTSKSSQIVDAINLVNGVHDSCITVGAKSSLYLTKIQSPGATAAGVPVRVRYTITNATGTALVGPRFTDTLPRAMRIARPHGLTLTNCGNPTIRAEPDAQVFKIEGGLGRVEAHSACVIEINIVNQVGHINSGCNPVNPAFSSGASNISNIHPRDKLNPAENLKNHVVEHCTVVRQNAVLTKKFLTSPILLNGVSTLEYTLNNAPTFYTEQVGMAFLNHLPSGIKVAAEPNVVNTCNGTVSAVAGARSIRLESGSLAVGAQSCTIRVNVTSNAVNFGGCPDSHKNGISNFSANANDQKNIQNGVSDQCLLVRNLPQLTQTLLPDMTITGVPVQLVLTLAPNGEARALEDYTEIDFTNILPAAWRLVNGDFNGRTYSTLNTCGGNIDISKNTEISLRNGTIPQGRAGCAIETWVMSRDAQLNDTNVPNCAAAFLNGKARVHSRKNVSLDAMVDRCLRVFPAAELRKAYSKYDILEGETTRLTFTLSNAAGNPAIAGLGFQDSLPSGLKVVSPLNTSNTCNGTLAVSGDSHSIITLRDGRVAANLASCTVALDVTSRTRGAVNLSCAGHPAAFTNTARDNISALAHVNSQVTNQCIIVRSRNVSLVKALAHATIVHGAATRLTFTASAPDTSGSNPFGFTDTLPAGWAVAAVPRVVTTCKDFTNASNSASVEAVGGGRAIVVSNAHVPAGLAQCTIALDVSSAPDVSEGNCHTRPEAFTNRAANITASTNLTNAISNDATNACLEIIRPILALEKINPEVLALGLVSDYTIRVRNSGRDGSLPTVNVFEQLPPYLEYEGAHTVVAEVGGGNAVTPTAVTCTKTVDNLAAGHGLSCTLSLPAGGIPAKNARGDDGSAAFTVRVQPKTGVDLAAPGVVNKARVATNNDNSLTFASLPPAACTANNTPAGCATAQQRIAEPIISISKQADPVGGTSRGVGQTITYTLTLTVAQAPLTSALRVTDTLSAGLTFGGISESTGFTCADGALITCTLPLGTPVGNYTLRYRATVADTAAGTVRSVTAVDASANGGDSTPACPANPACTVTHQVAPTISMSVRASHDPFLINAPDQYYEVTINIANGPTTAPIKLAVTLPTGVTLAGPPRREREGTTTNGELTGCVGSSLDNCEIKDPVQDGSIVIHIPLTVGTAATGGDGVIRVSGGGSVQCTAAGPPCSATITMLAPVDMPILAVDDVVTIAAGASGSTATEEVKVWANDWLGGGVVGAEDMVTLTQVDSSNANVKLNVISGKIEVSPGTAAGTHTLHYKLCEQLNQRNCSTGKVTVTVREPIISISKQADPVGGTSRGVGQTITYTLTLTVAQAPLTSALRVTDTLSAGLTFGGISESAGFTCADGALITCTLPLGTPVGNYTLRYRATVADTAAGTVSSVTAVDASANGGDSTPACPANPACTVAHQVAPTISMSVRASHDPFLINAPDQYYEVKIGIANGPTTAPIKLAVTLPVGVELAGPPRREHEGTTTEGELTGCVGSSLDNCEIKDPVQDGSIVIHIPLTVGTAATGGNSVIRVSGGGSVQCTAADPPCSATITMLAPVDMPILVVDDVVTIAAGANGSTATEEVKVWANDELGGALLRDLDAVILTQVDSSNANVKLNVISGKIEVSPGTAAGTHTLHYKLCEQLNQRNCSYGTVTVTVQEPIISISKQADPVGGTSRGVGQTITYTLTLTVAQAPLTSALRVTDTLSAGLAFGGISESTGFTCADGAPVTCTLPLGTLVGAYTLSYRAKVADTAAGTVHSVTAVDASANGGDSTPACPDNPACTVEHPVAPTISMSTPDSPPPFLRNAPGQYYEVTIDIANGPTTAPIELAATLPTGVTLAGPPRIVRNTTNGARMDCAGGSLANCKINAPVQNGSIVIRIPLAVGVKAATGGAGTISVAGGGSVHCTAADPCGAPITLGKLGNMSILAVDDVVTIAAGATGNTPDEEVTVWTNDELGGALLRDLDAVILTQVDSSNANVKLDEDGTIEVSAGTAAGTHMLIYRICERLNRSNCSYGTVTVTVQEPIISISKQADPVGGTPRGVGETITYTLTLTVAQAPLTSALRVVDTLSAGLTLGRFSDKTAPFACTGGAPITCTLPLGTPAGAYTLRYSATVADTAAGTVHSATAVDASANGGDSTPECLACTVEHPVAPTISMSVRASRTPFLRNAPGQYYEVTLGIANGPATAPIELAVTLPTGVTLAGPPRIVRNTTNGARMDCAGGSLANCKINAPVQNGSIVIRIPLAVTGTTATGAGTGTTATGAGTGTTATEAGTGTTATGAGTGTTATEAGTGTTATGAGAGTTTTKAGDGTIRVSGGGGVRCPVSDPPCSAPLTLGALGDIPILAVDDVVTIAVGAAGNTADEEVTVWVNDKFNGAFLRDLDAVTLKLVSSTHDNVKLDEDGTIEVSSGTAAGTYTLIYRICEQLNPSNCSEGTVTVMVASAPIRTVDDQATVVGSVGGAVLDDVTANDTLNGVAPRLGDDGNATVAPDGAWPEAIVLDKDTGKVSVLPHTPEGTHTLRYKLCEKLNKDSNCEIGHVTITVTAALVLAVHDAGSALTGLSATAVASVVANDTIGGLPVKLGVGGNATVAMAGPGWPAAIQLDQNTGAVTVAANIEAAVYSVQYRLCEQLNSKNCAVGTIEIVAMNPAKIVGRVWYAAAKASGPYDEAKGDEGIENFGAEVLDGAGKSVACLPGRNDGGGGCMQVGEQAGARSIFRTDNTGSYRALQLAPGTGYTVVFFNRAGVKVPSRSAASTIDLVAGQTYDGNAMGGDQGSPAAAMLPLDPDGVMYDSATRKPVPDVELQFVDSSGALVPKECLYVGQNPQITGKNGYYQFVLFGECAATRREYRLVVAAPKEYRSPSQLIPPKPGAVDGHGLANVIGNYHIQAQTQAPTLSDTNLDYYLAFMLGQHYVHYLNNHIALDPYDFPQLVVSKTGDKADAAMGDVVRYTVTVRNQAKLSVLPDVQVFDRLPVGFRLVEGSAKLRLGGAQKSDVTPQRDGSGWRFYIGELPGASQAVLTYAARVAVGAQQGDGINSAYAVSGRVRSLTARHQVQVQVGAFTQEACIIGSVYVDSNRNGMRDSAEPGVAAVRLQMEDGQFVVTDSKGNYHMCNLKPQVHVLKVDPTSLTSAVRYIPASNRNAGQGQSVFVDLKMGELHRADFALELSAQTGPSPQPPTSGQEGATPSSSAEATLTQELHTLP